MRNQKTRSNSVGSKEDIKCSGKDQQKRNGRRVSKNRSNSKSRNVRDVEPLDTSRSNNPKWYFSDERLADQVSQLAFQNLAGYPIKYDSFDFDVPNVIRICLNPSPGVQVSKYYNTSLAQNSAMNLAAFRLYSKLSAYTGRTQSYAPQDVATMVLAMGEIISITEFIRRAFAIAYTMNMRNRSYPKEVLEWGMTIDADDLFANLSNYRTQFNTIITLINQIPIPKNVMYFQKCAALYENIYLDSPSSMAQTLVTVPYTTWVLDEQSYSGGTVLKTTPVTTDSSFVWLYTPQPMSALLNLLSTMVSALLNSTTLQVVYTDLLNLASKISMEFWKMDFLYEDYMIMPAYDPNFMLQMHNATVTGVPAETQLVTGPYNVTPWNDVYPDPNTNSIFYNPAFPTIMNVVNGMARTGNEAIIDMLSDQVTVTDRVEVTRYTSMCKGTPYQRIGQSGNTAYIDTALPDHYIVAALFSLETNNLTTYAATSTILVPSQFQDISSLAANVDWAPRFIECNAAGNAYTGHYTGDVNFYTTVDAQYLRKLHDFVGLHLYDVN